MKIIITITFLVMYIVSVAQITYPIGGTLKNKDTKEPIITIKKSSITDLKATYTIESNEFLSN